MKNTRKILLAVWLGFFLLNAGAVLFYFFAGWIEADNFKAAMTQLSALYAPYLGMMLLFYWSKAGKNVKVRGGLSAWLALLCSALWNGAICLFFFLQPIEDAIVNARDIGGLSAWLVAGAVGYYFAQTS
jgi:hypothetical protein